MNSEFELSSCNTAHFLCPGEMCNLGMLWKTIQGTYLADITFSVIWANCMFLLGIRDGAGGWSSHRSLPSPVSSRDSMNEPGKAHNAMWEENTWSLRNKTRQFTGSREEGAGQKGTHAHLTLDSDNAGLHCLLLTPHGHTLGALCLQGWHLRLARAGQSTPLCLGLHTILGIRTLQQLSLESSQPPILSPCGSSVRANPASKCISQPVCHQLSP